MKTNTFSKTEGGMIAQEMQSASIKKVALIGLGAIGSVYASRLHQALPKGDFRVIAGGKRKNRIDQGVNINDQTFFFHTVEPSEKTEPADLMIFCTKFHHLPQAIQDVSHQIGEKTIILSLVNGISSEELIGEVYGKQHIVYGKSSTLTALRKKNGIYYDSIGYILLGEDINDPPSKRVRAIEALLKKANIPSRIPKDMTSERWWKYMVNVGANQVSAVMRAPYKDFQTIEELRTFTIAVMEEVIAVAEKKNIHIPDDGIDRWLKAVFNYAADGKTSMLQDVENNRKTEVEMLAGKMIEMGQEYGVPTPLNQAIYWEIRCMEKQYGAVIRDFDQTSAEAVHASGL